MHPVLRALVALTLGATGAVAQQEPPPRLDLSREPLADTVVLDDERPQGQTTREMRIAFVRNQAILGLASYAPAFAVMVGTEPATRLAGYLVMAGGTFFAATEITRQVEITPARQVLSSRMGWRGSLNGLVLADAANMRDGEAAALTLIGGLGGSAVGVMLGSGLTEGEAVATVVGHDIAFLSALAMTFVIDPTDAPGGGMSRRTRLAIPIVVGWGGYALGRLYAGRAPYEVTAGDAMLLWLGAGIGATAASTAIAESDPSKQTIAGTVLAGGLAGVWAADRWLVRRLDHTRSEGALVALGSGAGALMGIGLGVLVSGEAERGAAATFAFASLGGVAGIWFAERYAQPAADEGRRFDLSSRLQFSPVGALAAATGTPGVHPILKFTF
jgi:hypothetical protein